MLPLPDGSRVMEIKTFPLGNFDAVFRQFGVMFYLSLRFAEFVVEVTIKFL